MELNKLIVSISLLILLFIILLINLTYTENISVYNSASPLKNLTNLSNATQKIESRRLILETDEEIATANRLSNYFDLRSECMFDLGLYNNSTEKTTSYCPSTADYLICFPSTPANETFTYPCPYREGITVAEPNNNVTRYCQPNGTWASTIYIMCIKNVVAHVKSVGCHVKNRTNNTTDKYIECDVTEHQDNTIYVVMIYAYLIGFCITIVSVSFAIFIFLSIRSLRCVRNMIHCNMLFTFVVKCTGHIGFYVFMLSKRETIWDSNHFLCVVFNIILNYSLLCSFFWMMIEAVYLITVIVAAYSSNKIKLWWYLIIGWILPIIPIVPYAILTYSSSKTTCSWIKPEYNSVHEMFIDIPIYILLTINFVLLFIILYVIVTKLRNHNDATKFSQYKKLTRATVVLFPLFGLTFAIFFWLPPDTKTLGSKIYYFVNIFLQTTQGVWVSFVYCFLNDEVKNTVTTKLRSWKITHIGLISLGSSPRHHSVPTLYSTQLTVTNTNNNSIVRNRQDSTNPIEKLPILQEEDKL